MDEVPESHDDNKPVDHVGRNSKWDENMIEQAYLYCLEHHGTDRDLANHLGIGYSTLYKYMDQHVEFVEAIKRGRKQWRQSGCGNAVRSLYGMLETQIIKVPKVREKMVLNGDKMVLVERTVTMEQHVFPPSPRAVEFVLMNQDPENWRRNPDGGNAEDPAAFAAQVQEFLKQTDELHRVASPEG